VTGVQTCALPILGHVLPTVFAKAALARQIEANVVKRARGGGAAANWVSIGDVDASIVWDAVAFLRKDKLDVVGIEPQYMPIPGVDAVTSATHKSYDIGRVKVTIASLKCSKQPDAAAKFAEFAVAHRSVFVDDFGFSPVPDSLVTGTLSLHCGAGLRPAMEDAVKAFEKMTGTKIEASYQGSGTLITAIRLKQQGDLYMPGDKQYVEQAAQEGMILSQKRVCYFVPVILVQKDNPKDIHGLQDLLRPGLKLGLGDARTCAIGRTTKEVFAKNNIAWEDVEKNVAFQSLTVNELGMQIQAGSLDAVIVWDAIARYYDEHGTEVAIPVDRNVISAVDIGVLSFTKNRSRAEEFVEFVTSQRGGDIFRKHDYTVELPK